MRYWSACHGHPQGGGARVGARPPPHLEFFYLYGGSFFLLFSPYVVSFPQYCFVFSMWKVFFGPFWAPSFGFALPLTKFLRAPMLPVCQMDRGGTVYFLTAECPYDCLLDVMFLFYRNKLIFLWRSGFKNHCYKHLCCVLLVI